MFINGSTAVYGLIGNPVQHTFSPFIHAQLAAACGVNMAYVPYPVCDERRLGEAVAGAYALGIAGLNVTVPYKVSVMEHLAGVDELAHRIGAVNTLVRCEGGYAGYNSDLPGLSRALTADRVDIRDRDVVILGAGGVARAAAFLAGGQARSLYILNRNEDRAEELAYAVNDYTGLRTAKSMSLSSWDTLPDNLIVIQATSVGLSPDDSHAVIEDPAFYSKISVGYDLVFNPCCTRFMTLALEAGARAYNGIRMLVYQAVRSFELWTGLAVSDSCTGNIYRLVEAQI